MVVVKVGAVHKLCCLGSWCLTHGLLYRYLQHSWQPWRGWQLAEPGLPLCPMQAQMEQAPGQPLALALPLRTSGAQQIIWLSCLGADVLPVESKLHLS